MTAMAAAGKVMLELGPGPLGLCPVQGVAEVNQETRIWLANSGLQPIEVSEGQVVALAERVSESEGQAHGDDKAKWMRLTRWYDRLLYTSQRRNAGSWRRHCVPGIICLPMAKATWDETTSCNIRLIQNTIRP